MLAPDELGDLGKLVKTEEDRGVFEHRRSENHDGRMKKALACVGETVLRFRCTLDGSRARDAQGTEGCGEAERDVRNVCSVFGRPGENAEAEVETDEEEKKHGDVDE